jgi:hypothetical protein
MVVLTVEQMGHIVSLIPIFYQSSIFQIILLASSRGGRKVIVSDTVHFSTISYVCTAHTSSRVMVFLGSIEAPQVE